ncbi:hypothetical protein ACFYY2_12090 [Streptomyces sp. NPDC001822]|uniref:hypothetical protein n=1 Tax=Streptomyces sp. NPDC001822 TaxID=3364614 RepID=UPI0036A50C59
MTSEEIEFRGVPWRTSTLAGKIVEALDENTRARGGIDIPLDAEIRVGPMAFRYDDRRTRKRWYIAEHPKDF